MSHSDNSGGLSDDLEALLEAELNAAEDELIESAPPPIEQPEQDDNQATAKRQSRGAQCPPHPGFISGICIRCGALKDDTTNPTDELNDQPDTAVALSYIHHGLEISREEAERLRAFSSSHAAASRRLLLILDLDHTLLNTTMISHIPQEVTEKLKTAYESQDSDNPMLYHLPHMRMWTKFRPGLREFLTKAKSLFELHIYTMGTKDYAAEIVKVMDPDGQYFGGRVASSSDAGVAGVKDVDKLLGSDNTVLILDDTAGVWPKHHPNLLQVDRYFYFPADLKRFGIDGESYLEQKTDEDAETGCLATCFKVLEQVHCRYFEELDRCQADTTNNNNNQQPDVRKHLADIKSQILANVVILFTHVFPKDASFDVGTHHLWTLALQLGAQCCTEQRNDITHVVAGDSTTDKAIWGQSKGLHVVSPAWLQACAFRWKREDEVKYPAVKKTLKMSRGAAMVQSIDDEEEDLKLALAAAGGGGGE